MPKKLIYWLIIFILLTSFTMGCDLFKREQLQKEVTETAKEPEQAASHLRRTVFYFVNEHNFLVPVTRDIPWVEGIGKAALENLIDNAELRAELAEKGLRPTLPEGTRVLGMSINDGLAKVDFNANFLQFSDKTAEQNAINSVVYTLTEFPAIKQVQILIDGKVLEKTSYGNEVKALERKGINLETLEASVIASAEMIPVTLYFKSGSSSGKFDYFVPVTRMVSRTQNQIKTALEELIKGPADGTALVSPLPKDTKVLDVIQKDSEVVVNFSKEIEGYGGGVDVEQSVVNSVVLTVSEFPGVELVSIQVEGRAGVLPEGTVLETPIFKPLYVNPNSI
ncbi:MAG: hypothetical protein GXW90_09595 [Tepidanaerobacter acetatoxydans]|uniref:GerMN domain-containing protein n=1 Tax=Tepidanaerobacter acetatoxydans TaxID=499229 RepID=UPI0026EBE9CA|nr:GerMN domain-containing protein [Tepidanaerobacter acetatoxydans]NLU11166.1 hypothetical protein [Tepidanaerobacter acetatoxydans]